MSSSVRTAPLRHVQRRTLTLLSLAQIFSGIGTGAVVSTGSLLAVELSGSEAWAGSVTTTMTLGAAVASAALMRVALDRGRRIALSTGLLVGALGAAGVVLAAVTGLFWILVLSGALIGFGNAVNLQTRFAATDLSEQAHRGRDLSLVVWMSTVGAVAGPNLIGLGEGIADVLTIPALSGLFVISTAGMIAGMLIIWIGLRPDPYLLLTGRETLDPAGAGEAGEAGKAGEGTGPADPAARSSAAAVATAAADSAPAPNSGGAAKTAPEQPTTKGIAAGIRALWTHPGSRAGLVGIVVAHAVMVAVMSMTPVHLSGHGASVTIIGVTVSLHIAGMYVFAPVMGMLADRIGGSLLSSAGLMTLVAASLLAGFSGHTHWVTVIGLILLGLGWSAVTISGSKMIVDATPVAERVAAQGASDTLMNLAGAVGGVLAGVLLATITYVGLGVVSALIALAALPVLLRSAKRPA
ncbi:MAG: MFS transporter [Leucobacter sp.]